MYRVVTIAREYASGGGNIARRLAERLGWQLLDRQLLTEIAGTLGIEPGMAARFDERRDPWLYRFAKQTFQYGAFEGAVLPGQMGVVDADEVASRTRQLIEKAAEMGQCVIVGRAAQCILHGRPDTFHVFVYASREERMRRVQDRTGQGEDAAAVLDTMDRERAAYIRHYYESEWMDRRWYHLMINSTIGTEAAACAIEQALSPGHQAS